MIGTDVILEAQKQLIQKMQLIGWEIKRTQYSWADKYADELISSLNEYKELTARFKVGNIQLLKPLPLPLPVSASRNQKLQGYRLMLQEYINQFNNNVDLLYYEQKNTPTKGKTEGTKPPKTEQGKTSVTAILVVAVVSFLALKLFRVV